MGLEEHKQERVIDGFMYEVTPLPFGIGRKALTKFIGIAAPVIGSVVGAKDKGSVEAAMVAALPALATALSDEDLSYFASTFGKASKYKDGDRMVPMLEANQEIHFMGRYTAFFEWLAFAIEVNFSPFFHDLIALAKKSAGAVQGTTTGKSST